MSVWFAIVSSTAFILALSPVHDFSIAVRIVFAVVHAITFTCGMVYDTNRQDKIKKLEKEVEKLKGKLNA